LSTKVRLAETLPAARARWLIDGWRCCSSKPSSIGVSVRSAGISRGSGVPTKTKPSREVMRRLQSTHIPATLRSGVTLILFMLTLDGFGTSEAFLWGTNSTQRFELSDVFSWYPHIFVNLPTPPVVGCGHNKAFRALLDGVTGSKFSEH